MKVSELLQLILFWGLPFWVSANANMPLILNQALKTVESCHFFFQAWPSILIIYISLVNFFNVSSPIKWVIVSHGCLLYKEIISSIHSFELLVTSFSINSSSSLTLNPYSFSFWLGYVAQSSFCMSKFFIIQLPNMVAFKYFLRSLYFA